jgi:hypothetical protein
MSTALQAIVFGNTAIEEHLNLRIALKEARGAIHILGVRLAFMRDRQLWRELPATPPYSDFPDYVTRGLAIATSTAYRYIDASFFPATVIDRHGIDKTVELRKLVAMTAADETPEEAVALRLPLGDGETKSFEEATADEVRQARKIIKAGEGQVERKAVDETTRAAARAAESAAEAAVGEWLAPDQVVARLRYGDVVLDLRAVKLSEARRVFAALAEAMPEATLAE